MSEILYPRNQKELLRYIIYHEHAEIASIKVPTVRRAGSSFGSGGGGGGKDLRGLTIFFLC